MQQRQDNLEKQHKKTQSTAMIKRHPEDVFDLLLTQLLKQQSHHNGMDESHFAPVLHSVPHSPHCLQQFLHSQPITMFNYMGCTEEMVEEGVKKFGLAVGARKMIDNEYVHAMDSLETGLYVTYCNQEKKSECSRLGKHSKCFCGHLLPQHNDAYFGKKINTACKECNCKHFAFVPTRPEECGMYWLVRRKDFNVATWRPPCKCKHTNEQHAPNHPLKCKLCPCYNFDSNFACLTCDGLWEHHQTLFEREEERSFLKKPIREEYIPLASHKHIQEQVFKIQPNKSLPNKQNKTHEALNPKRPTLAEQSKMKSPLGFIMKPKYPDFMNK